MNEVFIQPDTRISGFHRRRFKMFIVIVALLLLGAGLLWTAIASYVWTPVVAKVTALAVHCTGKSTNLIISYSYEVNGQHYNGHGVADPGTERPPIGGKLIVYCNPGNFSESRLFKGLHFIDFADDTNISVFAFPLILLGVILMVSLVFAMRDFKPN